MNSEQDRPLTELTDRDIKICQAMALWVLTARTYGGEYYGPQWSPSYADITKSRLFWRIRNGQTPLPEPPPRAFSCPWYEVVEEEGPHYCLEAWFHGGVISGHDIGKLMHEEKPYVGINQCIYDLVEKISDEEAIVQFGSIKYHLWTDKESEFAKIRKNKGWFIQRIKDVQ